MGIKLLGILLVAGATLLVIGSVNAVGGDGWPADEFVEFGHSLDNNRLADGPLKVQTCESVEAARVEGLSMDSFSQSMCCCTTHSGQRCCNRAYDCTRGVPGCPCR